MAERVNKKILDDDLFIYQRANNKKGTWQILYYAKTKGDKKKEHKLSAKTEKIDIATKKAFEFKLQIDEDRKLSDYDFYAVIEDYRDELKLSEEDANKYRDSGTYYRKIQAYKKLDKDIRDITQRDLKEFQLHIKRGSASRSIKHLNSFLSVVFDYALSNEFIKEKPHLERKTGIKTKKNLAFKDEHIEQLEKIIQIKFSKAQRALFRFTKTNQKVPKQVSVDYKQAKNLRFVFQIMMATGARNSTIERMTPADFTKDEDGLWMISAITEKNNQGETIILPSESAYNYIETMVRQAKENNTQNERCIDYTVNHLSRIFSNILIDNNMKEGPRGQEYTLYSVRHWYITDAIRKLPIAVVADNAQTSISMIEKHYNNTDVMNHKDALRNVRKSKQAITGGGW